MNLSKPETVFCIFFKHDESHFGKVVLHLILLYKFKSRIINYTIMTDYRARPKADFIQETDWQELYVLTNHWKSDMLFYKDDLKFLHHLIDKYFIWITQKSNIEEVQKIGGDILKDTRDCESLIGKIDNHLTHLSALIKEPLKKDSGKFRDEHQELEDEIADFIKTVREHRKQLFKVTERVLDSEQLAHLMEK